MKLYLSTRLQVWFWPPLLAAYEITDMFYHHFFAGLAKGEVARREERLWLSTVEEVFRRRPGRQEGRSPKSSCANLPLCSGPDWKKLGATWTDLRASHPTIQDGRWCHVLSGVDSPTAELRTPGFSFQLHDKFHPLPWARKPNPHTSPLRYLLSSCLSVSSD